MRTCPWYGTERTEAGAFGLSLVHHGDRVPYGASEARLALLRALDDDRAAIPSERTRVAPARPTFDAAARPTFDADVVRRLQAEHHDGVRDRVPVLTSPTAVELWLQRFVDGR